MTQQTVPHGVKGVPVRALGVEVLEGPDAGARKMAPEQSLSIGTAEGNDLVLTDPTVSRYHLELSRRSNGILLVDMGSTNGVVTHGVQVERAILLPGSTISVGKTTLRVVDGETATLEVHEDFALCNLRGQTPVMRRLMTRIEKLASSDASVLLVGESGTGKEVIAEAVHELSPRTGPFVTVDCGALAPTLIASDLFGHERGAFTGADRRHVGAFERAHGGTLFLDEIGELPEQLQSNLLGVLERGRFRRLGGKEDVSVDVRIVSATNRDLRAEVNASRFRLDLYYRLAVVTLKIPPLRERVDDLPLLIDHFLRDAGHRGNAYDVFGQEILQQLSAHHWPGNVRELRNLVEATLATGEPPAVSSRATTDEGSEQDLVAAVLDEVYKDARGAVLADFEQRYLAHLLGRSDGNVSKAARLAKMDRSHLSELLKRHKLR